MSCGRCAISGMVGEREGRGDVLAVNRVAKCMESVVVGYAVKCGLAQLQEEGGPYSM